MIRLIYVLFVSFQVVNRIMRCFQFIKLETVPLTINKHGIVGIISVCSYVIRILIVHVAKFTTEEFMIFSCYYGKKCNELELLNLRRLGSKSYLCSLTWSKTIDKSHQWAIFSLNEWCFLNSYPHQGYAIMWSQVTNRPAAYMYLWFVNFFKQWLWFQTSSFYSRKAFHSLPKMKVKPTTTVNDLARRSTWFF